MLVVLDPAPVLEALHAVLNADYIKSSDSSEVHTSCSTMSYNVMHEDVPISPSARIILVAEHMEASMYHPSLLSRVSVLSQGVEGEGSEVKEGQETLRIVKPGDSPLATLQRISPDSIPEFTNVLRRFESVSDVFTKLVNTEQPTIAIVISHPCPLHFLGQPPPTRIAAAAMNSRMAFEQELRRARKSCGETPLVIDFAAVTFGRFVDYCVLLGLAGECQMWDSTRHSGKPRAVRLNVKIPKRILLLCPQLFASRLACRPRKHRVTFHWLDEGSAAQAEIRSLNDVEGGEPSKRQDMPCLHDMVEPGFLQRTMVQPEAEIVVAEALKAIGSEDASGCRVSLSHQLSSFGMKFAVTVLQRCVPFLQASNSTSIQRFQELADLPQLLDRYGGLRCLYQRFMTACVHRGLRGLRPWLRLVLQSRMAEYEVGRQFLRSLVTGPLPAPTSLLCPCYPCPHRCSSYHYQGGA